MRHSNLPLRICGCLAVAAGILLSVPLAPPAFAQGSDVTDRLSVMREDARSFRITRPELAEALVTFLSATTVRVRILAQEPETSSLPEYVTTKSESSYPPVDVGVDAQPDKVTFSTSAAILNLSLEDEVLSLELRTPDKVLIDSWEIDVGERVARIGLQNAERIYGFGDKRAAMDQRGQKIDIVNRDAFASESNQSYKSVPFYMSSAGYGLFFHNYRPSTFDVGASVKSRLQLKASGGEMDFYLFVGAMSEILSQFTELTGRPAMLPLWAFGYHQGKATYRGREGLDVGQQMRARKLPFDVIYYDAFDQEATSKTFIDALWERYRGRLTVGFGMPMFGTWRGNDDFSFAQRPCRARLPHGRSQQPPGDRPGYQRRGRGRQKLRGVSRLFFAPRRGPCLCGQMERRAHQRRNPRHGRLRRDGSRPKRRSEILAQQRHVGGADAKSVRVGLSYSRSSRASSTASAGAAPEWCGRDLREASGWAGPRPEIRFRPMPISARIPAPC